MADESSPLERALQAAERLPSLPSVAVEVLALCRSEGCSLGDLADVIARDPALSGKLLRFANSALYNLGHEVATLQRAALVLGLKTVQLMSLSFSLIGSPPWSGKAQRFAYEHFWRRSLACAVAGRTIASLACTYTDDEAFLCGLLGDIGLLVMAECMDGELERVLERSGGAWPTLELEREMLGFDHAELGMAVLRSWGLPARIYLGVRHLRAPDSLPPDASTDLRMNARILHLASLTVELLCSEQKGKTLAQLEDCATAYFQLSPEVLYDVITSLENGIREAAEMLDLRLAEGLPHYRVLEEAQRERERLLLDVTDEPRDGAPASAREPRRAPSSVDPATGIADEAALDAALEEEISARLGAGDRRPLSLLRLALEHLDELAQARGTAVAEGLVRAAAQGLTELVRRADLVAHVGRGQFCILVGSADPRSLRLLAERLCDGLEQQDLAADGGPPLAPTVSCAGLSLTGLASTEDGQALKRVTAQLLARLRARGEERIYVRSTPLRLRRAA